MSHTEKFDRLTEARPLADLFSAFIDIGLIGLMAFFLAVSLIPPWHLPWTPLRIDDPVGLTTHAKIAAITPLKCLALLSDGGVRYRRAPDRSDADFCEVRDAVVVTGGMAAFAPAGPAVTCRQALALAIWERQVLQPAASEVMGRRVTAITHLGSYNCRRVYGRTEGAVSEHATANALDVSGFRLAGGGEAEVGRDFRAQTNRGRFLRRVRDGGCRVFSHTLSPDYNAAHADHFHLDMGGWSVCR